jgi:hypothetical protein
MAWLLRRMTRKEPRQLGNSFRYCHQSDCVDVALDKLQYWLRILQMSQSQRETGRHQVIDTDEQPAEN